MKKFLVILLSLGLIAAFAATASAAVNLQFRGSYYVAGQYESNRAMRDSNEKSLSNFWTRTRIEPTFLIAEGLKLTTRFDALERAWGTTIGTQTQDRSNSRVQDGATRLQENIEFEQAWVTFKTIAGTFDVGYQPIGEFGTGFANVPGSGARVKMTYPMGPFTLMAIYDKQKEDDAANGGGFRADADWDTYQLAGIFKFKGGDTGVLLIMDNAASPRPGSNYRVKQYAVNPYVKGTFGPVYVEAEFAYIFGNTRLYEAPATTQDIKASGLGAYAKARMNFGPAYAGASMGYSSGDDPDTADKDESGPKSSTQWSPGIIFGDANYKTWVGSANPGGANGVSYNNSNKQNLWAWNLFGGYNVTPKLNLEANLWTMYADKAPKSGGIEYVSKTLGTEMDITATYKIYDNLSYMVGAGYFWAGDYFKGTNSNNKVGNDYMLLNKLTLQF